MPSAMIGNSAVQSTSPECGSGNHSEALKQVLGVMERKVRNMEKKKGKLDEYQDKKNKGERLNQDQLDALSKSLEVTHQLDFARELHKGFLALGQEIQKAVKKSARWEQFQREMTEQWRLKTVLELQFLLDRLGDETVRQDLRRADASGCALLTDTDLTALDDFYKLVGPERDHDMRLTEQYEEASRHLKELLDASAKPVAGTTYKALKETLDKVLLSGYFDRAQTHQNGVCECAEEEDEEEEEEEQQAVAAEESESGDQPVEPEGAVREEYTETIEVEATEFVNRQFIPDSAYSSAEDQVDEWTAEAQVTSLQLQAAAQLTPDPTHTVTPAAPSPSAPSPAATPDPVVRKQAVQDLMAQMQGTYNFMQDSMLEFDGHALDPAIVSAQPMMPGQTVDLQLACAPVHTESRLQPSAVLGPPEPTQASMSLLPEQPPIPASLPPASLPSASLPSASLPPAYPPVSKPSGINVNAAPFQSMQAVFNMNAPVPPANDGDSPKQPSQFPSGYSQGFSSQSEHSVEQPVIQPEALQSAVGGFQGPEPAGGPQAVPSQAVPPQAVPPQAAPPQGPGFARNGQAFFSSRAAPRGGPRNARGVVNGYRGAANGFRGGYDGYRPPFPNTPASGYGQSQFSAPRDFSSSAYQREGYQPGLKRGAAQGPRGCSRGNTPAVRS